MEKLIGRCPGLSKHSSSRQASADKGPTISAEKLKETLRSIFLFAPTLDWLHLLLDVLLGQLRRSPNAQPALLYLLAQGYIMDISRDQAGQAIAREDPT